MQILVPHLRTIKSKFLSEKHRYICFLKKFFTSKGISDKHVPSLYINLYINHYKRKVKDPSIIKCAFYKREILYISYLTPIKRELACF